MQRFATSAKDAVTADCVHVQHTVAVHCACKDKSFPTEPLPLGPIEDLIAPMIPIAVSFVYRYSGPMEVSSAFVSADLVRQAMAHVLSFYPPLSGRLVLLPNGDRKVDRLDSGALFVEATCTASLRELHEARAGGSEKADARFRDVLSMFDLPAGSNALFASFSPAIHHVVQDPLFTLQHTRFACGSVALGVRISHALTDAQGFFQVMQHLMELYDQLQRGEARLTLRRPPRWRSYKSTFRAEATPAEVAEALAYVPAALYVEEPPVKGTTTAAAVAASPALPLPLPSPPEVVGRELYFSTDELEELKRRATPSSNRNGWVSTFEALSAFLWQCVYRARCAVCACDSRMAHDTSTWPVTDYLTSINLRDRFLDPSTGEAADYFPVGCFAPVTKVRPKVLRDGPLHELAAAVHAMLRSPELSPNEVQRTVRWIAAQPDRSRIRNRFAAGGFMLSAWNKFDIYGSTACAGTQPVLVSTPFTCISLLDVLGYILPRPPSFADPAISPAATDDGDSGKLRSTASDGVVIYLAVDASLWEALSSRELLGSHLH
ncbi:Transferase family protein [Leptomonas pyrrhocoris]|uniref:Transferase family protein n=1 Tax=Leptomonas pyrrhocoris TaxID=157538 RepID=A0A0M9GA94_LEPPY|nr:Transferase family protein [Leptomonas pyrrhocoris]KPA86063.1 Transferase family protein [Leptomonas pyrrhocoris]|eukprot:XP_015664502.1 Transferase family protein [Leptomonas pyrrhocoris]